MNKSDFPIFTNNPELVYLDNAATTQKPKVVLDKLLDFYTNYNANVHRGLYPISLKASDEYELARIKIAKLINAKPEEIIFTSGATESSNMIASMLYSSKMISEKPRIAMTEYEHHSNILPWQQIPNSTLYFLPTNQNQEVNIEEIAEGVKIVSDWVTEPMDILTFPLVSNVTGSIFPYQSIFNEAAMASAYTIADASQAVGHMKIDVKEMNLDFLYFSGHKMYGPTGIGVLWAKEEILQKLNPVKFGGGMIREVKRTASTWAPIPQKFEAGTPSIADAIALGSAVDYLMNIGFEKIQNHETELSNYFLSKIKEIKGIKIYHPENAIGVISFSHEKIHPHDISEYLGNENICVRAGHHCVQIFHKEILNIPASVRISFGIYNDKSDVDKLIEALKEAVSYFE